MKYDLTPMKPFKLDGMEEIIYSVRRESADQKEKSSISSSRMLTPAEIESLRSADAKARKVIRALIREEKAAGTYKF